MRDFVISESWIILTSEAWQRTHVFVVLRCVLILLFFRFFIKSFSSLTFRWKDCKILISRFKYFWSTSAIKGKRSVKCVTYQSHKISIIINIYWCWNSTAFESCNLNLHYWNCKHKILFLDINERLHETNWCNLILN